MVHSQSDAPPFILLPRPYSRQLLHTRTLHDRQKAPRFMIRPNSDRHLPQLRLGSEAQKLLKPLAKLRLLVRFELATWCWWCGWWWWPLVKRPLLRSMANSDLSRLKKRERDSTIRKSRKSKKIGESLFVSFLSLTKDPICVSFIIP